MRNDRRFALLVGGLFLILASLPTWLAAASAGEGLVFGGVLLNPLDGNTYLAKAYQGWTGDWIFHLPYTPERGPGAYINLFYIALGHLARVSAIPIPVLYNLVRILAALLLASALWSIFSELLGAGRPRRIAFTISLLALGMGWLVVPFGLIPADLWVAEAYPLLSALTNPHFPFALGLITILANPASRWTGAGRLVRDGILAVLLALVSPFAVVVAALPWVGELAWEVLISLQRRAFSFRDVLGHPAFQRAVAITAGGLPVLLYDWLAINADPVLAGWNAQNITTSPAAWDLAISLSPTVLLAAAGARKAPKSLVAWSALGLVLVVIPFPLQRRFLMGITIPLAGLAGLGYDWLVGQQRRWVGAVVLLSFLPGPLLLLLTLRAGIIDHSPLLYLTDGEVAAFAWVAEETPEDALVLAGPETGLFLPAYTGRRVLYGHPFETVGAEDARAAVESFYQARDGAAADALLLEEGVDFVFFGPREDALGGLPASELMELVYRQDGVEIYAVRR